MGEATYELRWISRSVENIMSRNGIHNRSELAKRTGLKRSTVYEAFDEDWAGVATHRVLSQIAGQFRVPLSVLVVEPATQGMRRAS
ncbi:hypothetical protein BKG86_16995 [Mycobacteroides chelonae]|uniref:hypothetical protein n=1 Tax=Mycobacteroides chelonae TaxID=1774 RepID=UPI0008A9A1F5|nr:hypothetical protein [Mycobacteroides chelonae]OHU72281.1 hypothetical protein BKG86_16995 [Mycobacteroides chelonae]